MNRPSRLLAAAALTIGPVWIGAGRPAAAAPASILFTVAAQAPIMQIAEDEPTSTFHPEGEGEIGYSYASLSPSNGGAMATLVWPGSAAGNVGTLVEVLSGNSSLDALNDPVRAQAGSGTSRTNQTTSAPTGTTMTASVVPPSPGVQQSTAQSSAAGGGLGPVGSIGSSDSTSTITFDSSTASLKATATSSASHVSIDHIVDIGSVEASVTASSVGGSPPQLTNSTVVQQMTIAGQQAYVDGSGVHLGRPGAPAGPVQQAAVNAALAQSGMQIYFSSPRTAIVGEVAYDYSSSVLFYWTIPNDPSHNVFLVGLGAAELSTNASQSNTFVPPPITSPPVTSPAPPSTDQATPVASSPTAAPSTPVLQLPTPQPTATATTTPTLPNIAPPPTSNVAQVRTVSAGAPLPVGLGGWWSLIFVAAVAGAAGLSRVPGLLSRRAATACPYGADTTSQKGELK